MTSWYDCSISCVRTRARTRARVCARVCVRARARACVCPRAHTHTHTHTQAALLLRSWVWIQQGAWIFVCCECRVSSGRGLCDELITRPEESYRLWCVIVCDLETSRIRAPYVCIYIYDISSLSVNDLTLILLTWRKWWAPNNASKQQMGFNSAFKGLNQVGPESSFYGCTSKHCFLALNDVHFHITATSLALFCIAACSHLIPTLG